MWARIQRILPWAGTAALLGWLVSTTDLAAVGAAFRAADLALFAPAVVALVLLAWAVDSLTAREVLARSGVAVPRWDYLRMRGASALANVVSYPLALGAMAGLVSRYARRPFLRTGSPFAYLAAVDLAVLSASVLVATAAGASPFDAGPAALLAAAAGAGLAAGPLLLVLARVDLPARLPGRVHAADLLEAFRGHGLPGFALDCLTRAAYAAVNVCEAWIFLRIWGFDVPVASILVFEPMLTFVSVLPVSVAGLGSVQIAMRAQNVPLAPAGIDPVAAVDAYSTAVIAGPLAVSIAIGVACLPYASRLAAAGARRAGGGAGA
ncbi:MAG: flippase-like domain-containing protein [Deltaproteobacteria bacterium]|nr:flippase-like domain-containing protein [Deltaproteobacteria bacterium]